MRILRKIQDMGALSESLRKEGVIIGFVPTMGALHEGHLSLVKTSVKECGFTVVSIFVNPTQFGPGEDFDRYPRREEEDATLLEQEGCNALLLLDKEAMYPPGFQTWVEVTELSKPLCGRSRPGHFRGVATVVTKLFNIVRPHRAYFGRKDAQQALLIRRMTRDLDFGIEVRVLPTVREANGLALSSRNRYLSREERAKALLVPQAIRAAAAYWQEGGRKASELLEQLYALFEGQEKVSVDYIELVDFSTLEPVSELSENTLLALAVRVGSTRLIDNFRFGEDAP